jgi:hypothetical protein
MDRIPSSEGFYMGFSKDGRAISRADLKALRAWPILGVMTAEDSRVVR